MRVDTPLARLCGERIIQIATEKTNDDGYERLVLRALSGLCFEFKAGEISGEGRGGYTEEFYTVEMQIMNDYLGSFDVHDCDVPVGRVERLRRDEWTEPTEPFAGMIGINPRSVCSAVVGAAPPEAKAVTVTSGVIVYSATGDDALLISHAEFPGLLEICSVRNGIDDFRAEQSVEDVSCGPGS